MVVLENPNWLQNINISEEYMKLDLTKEEKKQIIKTIEEKINNKKINIATNYIVYLVLSDENYLFSAAKRKGFFRISNKSYSDQIDTSIKKILKKCNGILDDSNKLYLQSMLDLHSLSKNCRQYLKIIKESFKKVKKAYVKSLYAVNEYIFLKKHIVEQRNHDELTGYSKESIGEAISYIVQLYSDTHGIDYKDYYIINSDEFSIIYEALLSALKLLNFNDSEYLIETYNYVCLRNRKDITIYDPTDEFEKSMRMGFLRTEFQHHSSIFTTGEELNNEVASIGKFAELVINKNGNDFYKILTDPIRRLTFQFPWHDKIGEFFGKDDLFFEEALALRELQLETHIQYEDFIKIELFNNVTIFDIAKLQRFFFFFMICFNNGLENHTDDDSELILQSIVPIIGNDVLFSIVKSIYKDDQKSLDIINLLSWESEEKFDIQSTPLIKHNELIMYGPNTVATSNLTRNLLFLKKKRFIVDIEIIEKLITESFRQYTDEISQSIPFRYNGEEGDIDFICKIDNTIFIAECKNSLFGTTYFELRGNYEFLVKAQNQLNKIEKNFNYSEFKEIISDKVNFEIDKKNEFVFFVISGNRNFYGNKSFDYTVHPIYELISFLNNSTLTINNKKYKINDLDKQNSESIKHYISYTPHQNLLHESLEPYTVNYNYFDKKLIYKSFSVNMLKAEGIAEKEFYLVDENES